jgi:putative component of membrane protein insertase Oxa1/YidC/SpoIIIJ protein YidD
MVKRFLIFLIKGYQNLFRRFWVITAVFIPPVRLMPSKRCGCTARQGSLLAAWRILRCNPFGRPGLDPVPPKGKWRNDPPTPLRPDRLRLRWWGEGIRNELRRFPHGQPKYAPHAHGASHFT